MKRKKSPNKAPQQTPAIQPKPVMVGDVFQTFLHEAKSVGREVIARREWAADVVEFLESKELLVEWSDWRKAKRGD
jgi:hypothetical protein